MNYSKISVRYSKALFLLAKEKELLDNIKDDIYLIGDSIKLVPEFSLLISSPIIAPSKKQEIIQSIFKNKIHQLTFSFLNLLVNNKREDHIADIIRNFIKLYKKDKNIKTVVLTTPVSIDQSLENEISKLIKTKFETNIELIKEVDKNIIGGFILKIENQLLDASVSSQLKRIKQELLETHL